jgi:hypothetical protein
MTDIMGWPWFSLCRGDPLSGTSTARPVAEADCTWVLEYPPVYRHLDDRFQHLDTHLDGRPKVLVLNEFLDLLPLS